MKKEYTGIWSNGKKTIDLDNLNSKYELKSIEASMHSHAGALVIDIIAYARESGTIVEKYTYDVLDDYFLDIGAITHKETFYRVLGKNFKKIKEKGTLDEDYQKFIEFYESYKNRES